VSLILSILVAAAAPVDAPTDDPVDRVAAALAAGEAAIASGRTRALRDALGRIEASGARPLETDVAQRWRTHLGRRAPPPSRGRGLGPGYRMGTLASGEVLSLEQIFLGGEQASIAAQTLGSGVLRLEITANDGRAACAPPAAFRSRCHWVPVFTQRFAIRLTNATGAPMPYYLAVN
jgi:hypothetical protein